MKPTAPLSFIPLMGLTFESQEAGTVVVRLPALPALCSSGGSVRLGALATLVDCVVGYDSLSHFDGAWVGTSEMTVHGPFRATGSTLVATGHLLKRRRDGGVFEVDVATDDDPAPVAVGTVVMSMLSRQDGDQLRSVVAKGADTLAEVSRMDTLSDLLDPQSVDGGLRLPIGGHLRNSWQVLNGGTAVFLAELEAERAATAAGGRPYTVDGMAVHYLSPGRVGPVNACGTVLSIGDNGTAYVRVLLTDAGADDRPVLVVLATARPGPDHTARPGPDHTAR